jgi:hypothetical protein
MLDSYVRKLVGNHQHILRQFGSKTAKIVNWGECYDDPQAQGTRDRGTAQLWRYDKSLYSLYKSATLHTVKRKIPLRLKLIPALLLVVAVLAYYSYSSITALATVSPTATAASAQGFESDGDVVPGQRVQGSQDRFSSPEAYLKAHVPRFAAIPGSAPVFDGRQAVSQPQLFCAAREDGYCICHTEQGTRYPLERRECYLMATQGRYDPYKQPMETTQQNASASAPTSDVATASQTLRAPVPIPEFRDTPKYPPQTLPSL